MWGLCVFSFSHFSLFFFFPWKSSDHNRLQWGWNFDIDCQQGSKLSSSNCKTLKNKMNDALIWKASNWLSDLSVFKAPADLETGFRLALQSQGKTEAHGLLLWGDRETNSKVSHLSVFPWPPFFTVLLFFFLVTNSPQLRGNARSSTKMSLNSRKIAIWVPRVSTQKAFFSSF